MIRVNDEWLVTNPCSLAIIENPYTSIDFFLKVEWL